ncbi:hypothetical protein [Streptomyces sp. IBSBF 3136]|uniref:beta-xylosidase family glycoside hydrolase n=1 Tax=Streptomyces sp. IBSBF 3136 TaxID=2903524 RepID=UPI002FDC1925
MRCRRARSRSPWTCAERGSRPPAGPDTVAFSVETPEGAVRPAELDGRCLSTEVAGGFTGRVVGMYVTEGRAAFDWFDYEPRAGARDLDAPDAPS